MSIHIIVDGYNLIRQSKSLRHLDQQSLELGRDALLESLVQYKRLKSHKITVVFDGNMVSQPSNVKQSGMNIHYSVPPKNADVVIKILLKKKLNHRNITVISSDNEVTGFARTCQANTMRSEEFYRKYLTFEEKFDASKKERKMSKAELNEWLKIFGQSK